MQVAGPRELSWSGTFPSGWPSSCSSPGRSPPTGTSGPAWRRARQNGRPSSSDRYTAEPVDPGYAMLQGLFRLTRNLVSTEPDGMGEAPLLMLVDDAHHADAPSLRFLAYLARRIAELPIGLVVTVRAGEASSAPHAVAALREAAADAGPAQPGRGSDARPLAPPRRRRRLLPSLPAGHQQQRVPAHRAARPPRVRAPASRRRDRGATGGAHAGVRPRRRARTARGAARRRARRGRGRAGRRSSDRAGRPD
jgi:hypothetical protein